MKNSGKRCLSPRCLENLLYYYFRSRANLDLASAAESTWLGSVFLVWALSMQTDAARLPAPCATAIPTLRQSSQTAITIVCPLEPSGNAGAQSTLGYLQPHWLPALTRAQGLQRGDVVPHLLWLESCSQPSLLRAAIQGCVLSFQAPALPSSTYKKYLTETRGFMQKSSKSYLTILL